MLAARKSPTPVGRVGNGGAAPQPKPTLTAPRLKIPSVAVGHSSPFSAASRGSAVSTAAAPTSTVNTARSGSGTARTATATATAASTARSASAVSTGAAAAAASRPSSAGAKPFHRPLLATVNQRDPRSGQHAEVPVRPIVDARPDRTLQRSDSSGSATGAGRSASTVADNEQSRHAAAARITRSPSPAKIPARRCKHCSALVPDIEKHAAECSCAPLECALHDSESAAAGVGVGVGGGNTVCAFVARGAKHLAEHRETQCPFRRVACRNAELGCGARVSVVSMDRHLRDVCAFAVYVCEFCHAQVTRGAHEAHVATECPGVRVLCPLGCGRDIPRCDVEAHIRDNWADPQHPRAASPQGSSSSDSKLPPESARRVAETLVAMLERQAHSHEAQTILAASDDLDAAPLGGGGVDSLEHSLFVGQSVWRSLQRLMEWCSNNSNNSSNGGGGAAAQQQVFEILERRAESAKMRLAKHAAASEVAAALKNSLDTSLGKVALKICE